MSNSRSPLANSNYALPAAGSAGILWGPTFLRSRASRLRLRMLSPPCLQLSSRMCGDERAGDANRNNHCKCTSKFDTVTRTQPKKVFVEHGPCMSLMTQTHTCWTIGLTPLWARAATNANLINWRVLTKRSRERLHAHQRS